MFRRTLSRLGSITQRNTHQHDPYLMGARINIAKQYDDLWDKHRMRLNLPGDSIATPLITGKRTHVTFRSFVAPSASLLGHVEVWDFASIWYNVIIKADVNLIRIGAFVNIQDNTTILEATGPLSLDHDGSTIVGHHTTVGHGCKLQATTIEDECFIGMGCILNEESYMETQSMLGAGAVLARGARVPTGELWAGNPAKFLRMLTHDEMEGFKAHARKYWEVAEEHKREFYLPVGEAYIEAEKLGFPVGWEEDFWGNRYLKKRTPLTHKQSQK